MNEFIEKQIQEIADINLENAFPEKEFGDKMFNYIDISSVSGYPAKINVPSKIKGIDAPSRAKRVVHTNDVLVSNVRPYLKAFALVGKENDGDICSTGFSVLSPKNDTAAEYLYYALLTSKTEQQFRSMMRGANYPAINNDHVKQTKIPTPPLEEQKKIAAVLSTVQNAIEKSHQLLKSLDKLKHSVLEDCISSLDVEKVNLSDLAEFKYGTSRKCDEKPIGTPVLRIPNVIGGKIDTDDMKYTNMDDSEIAKFQLKNGDVLIVRTNGQKDYVGRTAVYEDQFTTCAYASYLIRIRLDTDKVIPNYFQYFSESKLGKSQLSGRAASASDGKYNINQSILSDVKIPLISLDEQESTVQKIQSVDNLIESKNEELDRLKTLFGNLLDNLMSAEIRVNDLDIDYE